MSVKIERKIIAGWEDITDMLESGRLSYQRAFSTFCGSEAVLDIHESDEATAFAKYAKKSVIRISQTERAEKTFWTAMCCCMGQSNAILGMRTPKVFELQ